MYRIALKEAEDQVSTVILENRCLNFDQYQNLTGQLTAIKLCQKAFEKTIDEYENGDSEARL